MPGRVSGTLLSQRKERQKHTSSTKRINDLIRLLLIIKIPSLLESAPRLGLHVGSLVLLPKIQTIEDENAGHPQIPIDLQFPLDVILQREGETTQGDQERFAGRVVEEVLGDVV